MIRYALRCPDAHGFDSWFKSSEAFDALNGAGMVACPECGSTDVSKAVMAPPVRASRVSSKAAPAQTERPLSQPDTPGQQALAELRRKIETTSDYVGPRFAAEARRMHDGEVPHRSIYGEANVRDARQLLEEGVPVAPLPFIPLRKTN